MKLSVPVDLIFSVPTRVLTQLRSVTLQ